MKSVWNIPNRDIRNSLGSFLLKFYKELDLENKNVVFTYLNLVLVELDDLQAKGIDQWQIRHPNLDVVYEAIDFFKTGYSKKYKSLFSLEAWDENTYDDLYKNNEVIQKACVKWSLNHLDVFEDYSSLIEQTYKDTILKVENEILENYKRLQQNK